MHTLIGILLLLFIFIVETGVDSEQTAEVFGEIPTYNLENQDAIMNLLLKLKNSFLKGKTGLAGQGWQETANL
ncbi:MAG: hypothetical protein K6G18_03235 [Treponema sp.]|nr:hypothetical protein [Treponema sp.]